jgi:hypothetical protein
MMNALNSADLRRAACKVLSLRKDVVLHSIHYEPQICWSEREGEASRFAHTTLDASKRRAVLSRDLDQAHDSPRRLRAQSRQQQKGADAEGAVAREQLNAACGSSARTAMLGPPHLVSCDEPKTVG